MRRLSGFLAVALVVFSGFVSASVKASAGPADRGVPRDVVGHWAEAEIRELMALGVVNGYPDGTFRPDAKVTRAEFVKMLVTALGLQPVKELPPPFEDVSGHWLYTQGYLEAAWRQAIVVAVDYTVYPQDDPSAPPRYVFHPDGEIPRSEMAAFVVRAMRLWSVAGLLRPSAVFTDASSGEIVLASNLGIITGFPDGTFRPDQGATRAEAATIIRRMLDAMRVPQSPVKGTFVRTYGTHETGAYAVEALGDGGFVIAGKRQDWGAASSDAWLLRTDAEGNVLWEKTYGAASCPDAAYDVRPTADGGFVFVGVTGSGNLGSQDGWLVKTDASGDETMEAVLFSTAGWDEARAVVEAPDGGFVVAGTSDTSPPPPFEDTYGDVMVAKVGKTGGVDWTLPLLEESRAWDLTPTADGRYLVVGFSRGRPDYHNHAWAAKVTADGKLVWLKRYPDTVSDPDEVRAVVAVSDGGYLLAGNRGRDRSVRLIKVDPDGSVQWDRTFEPVPDRGVEETTDAIEAADGGFVVVGEAGNDVWLAKTDAEGKLLWARTFYRGMVDIGSAVVQSADGGYAITLRPTMTAARNEGGAVLLKTDEEGSLFLLP